IVRRRLSLPRRPRPSPVTREGGAVAPSFRLAAGFFLGGALGGRDRFQALVRNQLAALDREAVRAGREPGLGALDGGELFAECLCEPLVELVLVDVRCRVRLFLPIAQLAAVLVREPRERALDPLALRAPQPTR